MFLDKFNINLKACALIGPAFLSHSSLDNDWPISPLAINVRTLSFLFSWKVFTSIRVIFLLVCTGIRNVPDRECKGNLLIWRTPPDIKIGCLSKAAVWAQ